MEWVEIRVLSGMPSVPAYRPSSRWGQIWSFPGRLAWPQPCPGVSPSTHCPGTPMETSPGAGRCADVAVPRSHLLHILCPCQRPFANSPSSQPSLQSKHLVDATWCSCSGSTLATGATLGGWEWENPLFSALSALWGRETGLQDWEGSSCLPVTPGDTCSSACQCSALGWTWLPAHACIPPLWGCPKNWGHGWELPLCWLMSVGMLQCCGETEAELVCREPQPAGLRCLVSHSKHSLQFPLVVFFPFSSSELLARSRRMG